MVACIKQALANTTFNSTVEWLARGFSFTKIDTQFESIWLQALLLSQHTNVP